MIATIVAAVLVCAGIAASVYFGSVDAAERRRRWHYLTTALPFRFGMIVVMTLAMLIPLEFVDSIVDERAGRYQGVLRDIAGIWGRTQTVAGPLLVVPYEYEQKKIIPFEKKNGEVEEREKIVTVRDRAVFLPEALDIKTVVDPQYRHRGIYRSLVYKAAVTVGGQFAKPDFSRFPHTPSKIDWDGAYLSLGLSDTRAINDSVALTWNDRRIGFSPGTRYTRFVATGLHAELRGFDAERAVHDFSLALNVNGSGGFYFTPVGKRTTAQVTSSWPDPSFRGSILPAEREIGADGFDASWRIPHLARAYPQSWTVRHGAPDARGVRSFNAGVQLFEPVDFYRTSERAIKYGILFIGLTFLAFFLFEYTLGVRLNVIQYALVGGALAMFYLLLISLAEHIGFLNAYMAAAAAVVVVVTLYAAAALKSFAKGAIMGVVLAATYALLYVLLQQQDYALLLGSGLLFAVLAVTMFLTRNLNRETVAPPAPPAEPEEEKEAA